MLPPPLLLLIDGIFWINNFRNTGTLNLKECYLLCTRGVEDEETADGTYAEDKYLENMAILSTSMKHLTNSITEGFSLII